jgi:hypothetical protein
MADRYTEYMRLDAIKRAPKNAKMHDFDGIRRAIEHYGSVEQMALDDRTGRLVAGHGRLDVYEYLHEAGRRPPDGVNVDTDGMWLAPVGRGWSSRNDEEAEAYVVASNWLTMKGGHDDRELYEMLAELQEADVLALTGVRRRHGSRLVGCVRRRRQRAPTGGNPV